MSTSSRLCVNSCVLCLLLRVGVGSSLAAERGHDVDESPVVLESSLGSPCLLLLLLLLVNLHVPIISTLPVHVIYLFI